MPMTFRRALAAATFIAVLSGAAPAAAAAAHPTPALTGTSQTASATKYLQPVTQITPAKGCVVLTAGMNGVKVRLVQRRLGMGSRWETMDAATRARVKAFQKAKHLKRRDGVVDADTWKALGIREDFCFDRWQAKPSLPLTATGAQRVATMIAFARGYLGAEYVWGGAGQRKYGVDCSGLVLQALYAAGLEPAPVTVDKHVLPQYRSSLELYKHPRLKRVPRSQMRRGDLIFYTMNSTGRVNHVAIYLGKGRLLEAKGEDVHIAKVNRRLPNQTMT